MSQKSQEYHQSFLKPIVNTLFIVGFLLVCTHFVVKYYNPTQKTITIQTSQPEIGAK